MSDPTTSSTATPAPPAPAGAPDLLAAGPGSDLERPEPPEPVDEADAGSRPARLARLEEEGEVAADYLEELLDIADLDGDIDLDVVDGRAVVSVVADDEDAEALDRLAGEDGDVLEALQELTRLAVQARTGERSRLVLDIAGFRARRRQQLTDLATEVVERVRRDGEPVELEPMNPFERKVVHDVIAAAGLVSDSEGVEPTRYVVVRPG